MGTSISVTVETGYFQYPTATATFDGTNITRFWHDPHLRKSLFDAAVDAKDDKDIFDFCNFLFAQVNNAVKRRYGGQELQLVSVTVNGEKNETLVTSYQ